MGHGCSVTKYNISYVSAKHTHTHKYKTKFQNKGMGSSTANPERRQRRFTAFSPQRECKLKRESQYLRLSKKVKRKQNRKEDCTVSFRRKSLLLSSGNPSGQRGIRSRNDVIARNLGEESPKRDQESCLCIMLHSHNLASLRHLRVDVWKSLSNDSN